MKRILCRLLGVTLTVITGLRFEEGCLIVGVRPRRGRELRCPECGRRCPRYDAPRGARRWRALDLCSTMCFLEYAPCASRFTAAFEEQVAWLCVNCNTKTVSELMRVDWHTVGGICARVEARLREAAGRSRLDGLRRIGIDETSYTKGQRYLTVVVDHDRGCVVWCARGHDRATLDSFFGLLTQDQRASIEVVTRDGARWIADAVSGWCPNAEQVMDPFHAVQWVTDALDGVRRGCWREANAGAVKGSRYAVLKNPEDLTEGQARTLAAIERESPRLWRAYNIKERFRDVFKSPDPATARTRLDAWLSWASRCRIPEMVEAGRKVRRRRDAILRAVELGISNARVEAINNKIKVTQRMAYGFRNVDNLIALVMLRCSDLEVALPGRAA